MSEVPFWEGRGGSGSPGSDGCEAEDVLGFLNRTVGQRRNSRNRGRGVTEREQGDARRRDFVRYE